MYNNKTIAVVVPCYNEENQIGMVIETMPEFVDRIIIVNDKSTDKTADIVRSYFNKYKSIELHEDYKLKYEKTKNIYQTSERILKKRNEEEIQYFVPFEIKYSSKEDKIILINLSKNSGVGAAIACGYKWAKDHDIDCTAVMDGDGQMDPNELKSICHPIINDDIDYVKGNRLIHRSSWFVIPKIRYFGNSILSILTKIASGYWNVSDTQTGYTAISKKALNSIDLHKIYKHYGMPNDMLVKLNISFCTLKEVEIKPIYNIGEQSKMKIAKVILPITWLLIKSFFKRLYIKYLFRDFHPLFLLYHLGIILLLCSFPFFIDILSNAINIGKTTPFQTLIIFIFLNISGFQSLLFAMWMDIQDNQILYK